MPNLLCVSRIAAAPLLAHLIVDKGDFPLAVAVFAYAGVTDVVRKILLYVFCSDNLNFGPPKLLPL